MSNNRTEILKSFRKVSVILVTLLLLTILLSVSMDEDMIIFFVIILLVQNFFLSIPIIAFWLYSFILFIFYYKYTSKTLRILHFLDIAIVIGILLQISSHTCDATTMEKHYNNHSIEMRVLISETRKMLTDSVPLFLEFEHSKPTHETGLSEHQIKQLKQSLERVGCIGININPSDSLKYGTLLFRRVGMGLYSYRLYKSPLHKTDLDNINADDRYIVYNDSTVFEYAGGVFGTQIFEGKDSYLQNRNK